MAWSIPTYAGTYMGGKPSNARIAMFELCRAVNERQAALALTKTTFYNTAGALAADRVVGDFENIRATGASSYAYQNLERVRTAITTMLNAGRFATASGGPTIYTVASMESAIGASISTAPTRPQQAAYWQALKDALDRMIYAYTPTTTYTTGISGISATRSGGVHGTAQSAWDDRATDPGSGSPVGLVNPFVAWYADAEWRANITSSTTGIIFRVGSSLTAVTLQGVYAGGKYTYRTIYRNMSISDIDVLIGADTITVNTGGTAEITATSIPMGSPITKNMSITTTEPTTHPFGSYASPGPGIGAQITGLNIYHDIASVLTDQA